VSTVGWWWTEIGEPEKTLINRAIDDRRFSQGSYAIELENALREKLQVPHVIVTPSGSVALLMAMMAAGVGPGDEVIVPDRTWIATAHGAAILGAKIVLVDSEPHSPVIDVGEIAGRITPRTKAIVPVHLNGHSCDMQGIQTLARPRGICVVEDAAQAMLSRSPLGMLGTIGDMGCFSLGMTKLISTGHGGAIATRRQDLYDKLFLIRENGVTDRMNEMATTIGCNFRISDLQSAMGLAQLGRAEQKVEHVLRVYHRYLDGLANLPHVRVLQVDVDKGEVPLWTEVICRDRAKVAAALLKEGIEIHLGHRSLSRSPQLKASGEFPNSQFYDRNLARLPCGPGQPLKNVDRVIEIIRSLA
jgi:dTDP-4-amino-4,6-dideoxygalactose transaminase